MAVTFVQGVAHAATPYPMTFVLPSSVMVGNRIILLFMHSYAGCPPSVTDSLGNTYTQHGTQLLITSSTSNERFEIFSAPVTTAGSCTITVAAACGSMLIGFALEYAGLDPTAPFDGQAGVASATTALTSGSVTTTTAGDLVLGLFQTGAGINQAIVVAGGATLRVTASDNSILEELIQATAGAINPSATGSGSSFSSFPAFAGTAAFKAAAGASPVSGVGAVTLPHLTASGSGAALAKAVGAAALPHLTAAGTATSPHQASGAASLPHLTAVGTAQAPARAAGTATLPQFTASGTGSVGTAAHAAGAVTLPHLTAGGAALSPHAASASVTLPHVTASGSAQLLARAGGVVSLPHFLTSGQAAALANASGLAVLPMFRLAATGHTTPIGAHDAALAGAIALRPRLSGLPRARPRLVGTITISPAAP
jgi:hypothetical protein